MKIAGQQSRLWLFYFVFCITQNTFFMDVKCSPTQLLNPRYLEFGTSCSVVVDSPFLMFLMGGEESNVKLAPASCAYSDEIILLWIPLSFSKGVRAGAGNW